MFYVKFAALKDDELEESQFVIIVELPNYEVDDIKPNILVFLFFRK